MEDFCTYNLFKIPKPNLMIPPHYVRASEGRQESEEVPNLQLKASDPAKLLMLCESLKEVSTKDLEIKINNYFMEQTSCQVAFLINLVVIDELAVIGVIGNQTLPVNIHLNANDDLITKIINNKEGIEFPFSALNLKLQEVIKSAVPDARGTIYAFPIYEQLNSNGKSTTTDKAMALVCIVNCTLQKIFVSNLVQETFRFCLTVFANTTKMEEECRKRTQSDAVLAVAQKLNASLTNFEGILQHIIEDGIEIMDAEKCELYLLDKNKKNLEQQFLNNSEKTIKHIIPKDQGIAGYVVSTGECLNISNPYEHKLFHKGPGERECKTRNIICFTVRNDEKTLGVVLLINKKQGEFNLFDEQAASLLGYIWGTAISYTLQFKKNGDALEKYKLSAELLLYHAPTKQAEIKHIMYAQKPSCLNFGNVNLNPRNIPLHQTPLFVMKMYEDLNFIETFNIDKRALAAFIATVQNSYKKVPYHNWMHAFSATYFAYSCIMNFKLIQKKMLTDLEAIALLTAIICHDVDHAGNTSSMHGLPWNTLASLYSSNGCLMEKYHLAQTIAILNSNGCNFLKNLTNNNYRKCLEMIKTNILASDLTYHIKHLKKLEILVVRGYRLNILEDRALFQSLLVTCSDLSDQVRDWKTVRDVAAQLYSELFVQGDIEKILGKQSPQTIDRNKACVPNLHIDFLRDICLPPFTILTKFIPNAIFTVNAILLNIRFWEQAKRYFMVRTLTETTSLEILEGNVLNFTEMEFDVMDPEDEDETVQDTTYYDTDY